MATNEGATLDLTAVAEASGMLLALVQAVALLIPLLTVAMLVLLQVRHSHAEHRRATSHRVHSALR